MIALDTNVLVRYLVEDDKAQSAKARALVNRAVANHESLFVPDIVVCETVWVLTAAYEVTRAEVRRILSLLLTASHLRFRDLDQLARARDAFDAGRGDFADYLIREQAVAAGCERVATFDRALLSEQRFSLP